MFLLSPLKTFIFFMPIQQDPLWVLSFWTLIDKDYSCSNPFKAVPQPFAFDYNNWNNLNFYKRLCETLMIINYQCQWDLPRILKKTKNCNLSLKEITFPGSQSVLLCCWGIFLLLGLRNSEIWRNNNKARDRNGENALLTLAMLLVRFPRHLWRITLIALNF